MSWGIEEFDSLPGLRQGIVPAWIPSEPDNRSIGHWNRGLLQREASWGALTRGADLRHSAACKQLQRAAVAELADALG